LSRRSVAYVIALVAVLLLGVAGAIIAKSTLAPQSPAAEAAPAVEGYSLPRTPVCDEMFCEVKTVPAAQAPSEAWPTEGLVP
jgi:Flp pilus assembly protein CpaB